MKTRRINTRFLLWDSREHVLRAIWAVVLTFAATCPLLAGCSKTTKPRPVKYNIYIGATHVAWQPGDSSTNRIYVYDTDSLTLIDSIVQAHYTYVLAVSPEGEWLYILDVTTLREPSTLFRMNARTKQVAWQRPVAPENRNGLLTLLKGGELLLSGRDVLRTADGEVLRHLDSGPGPLRGPVAGTMVAAVGSNEVSGGSRETVVLVIDVTTGDTTGRYVPRLTSGLVLPTIRYAVLHPDRRRVLAIGCSSLNYSWFVVGDVVTGQTLGEFRLSRPNGEVAIGGNGSLAVVTDPPDKAFYETPSAIDVIDLDRWVLVKRFTVEADELSDLPSQVRILPGDMKAVVAPAPDFWETGALQVINLATMTVERPRELPSFEPFIGGLDVGPRP